MNSNLLFPKNLKIFLFLVLPFSVFAQNYFVDFEDGTSSSVFTTNYGIQVGDLNNLEWQLGPEVLIGDLAADQINGDRVARLRGRNGSIMTMLEDKLGGLGTVSFLYKQYGTDGDQQPWQVEYSIDGGTTWVALGNEITGTGTIQTFSESINLSDNGRIRVVLASTPGTTGNRRLNIDDILITDFSGTPVNDTIVSILTNNTSVSENSTVFNVNFNLNQSVQLDKTVDFVLVSGNAIIVNGFSSETITFTGGGATNQSTSLVIVSGEVTGSETLVFQLQNPSTGLNLGTNIEFELTVEEFQAAPYYTIAQVRGNDINGSPDSLGVECRLSGRVLGINYTNDPGLNFFINDGTGGINLFAPVSANNNFGYNVTEGDSIEIQGTIATFRGQAQVEFLTDLQVLGTGVVPQAQVVTELNEDTEGELVTLENVTVVNQNQWTQAPAGFSLFVYNATDTFEVRLDSRTDVFNLPIPGCELNITGIGAQRASTTAAPFEDGYRIFPRSAADFDVLDICPDPGTTSIFDIQFTNDASEDSPFKDQVVTTSGIVSAVRPGGGINNPQGFYIQDGTGPWSGVFVFNSTFSVSEGDSVELTGTVKEFFGQTEIDLVTDLTVLSSDNSVQFTNVSTNQANTEPYEGVVVRVTNATCTNANAGFGQFEVDDNSGPCLVDDDIYEYPNPTLGVVYSVTGPVRYSFSEFKIEPRRADDVEVGASVDYPLYEIQEVTTIDNNGVLDSLGVQAKLVGTVLGVNLRSGGLEFTIHDGTGGIGVFAPAGANTFGYTVTEGDLIEVQGEITQFRGLAQIAFLQSLSQTGTGTLPIPTVVTSLGEFTESELVKFENVSLADPSEWPAPGSNAKNVVVNLNGGGAIDVRIFPQTTIAADLNAPDGVFDLIGIGSQFSSSTTAPFNDGYRLIPRYKADFDITTSISNTLKLLEFNAYPNPVTDFLKIEFDYSIDEAALIQVYDVTGKLVLNTGTLLNRGYNQINFSTKNINAGYYFVRVLSDTGSYTINIIKE